jgi:hypothetical protein
MTLLEGHLGAISLTNLLQLIALEHQSAVLKLRRIELNTEALLFFSRGKLIAASTGSCTGELAFYRIISWWKSGKFELKKITESELPPVEIHKKLDFMLLEAMHQIDEGGQYRQMITDLKDVLTFTAPAQQSFVWQSAHPQVDEWLPNYLKSLPKTFSIAQLLNLVTGDEREVNLLLRMLLNTQAVRLHSMEQEVETAPAALDDLLDPAQVRYEGLSQILMEFLGYQDSKETLDMTLDEMEPFSLGEASFNQLIDLVDRLTMIVQQKTNRQKGQEAMKRLRARVTSLIG